MQDTLTEYYGYAPTGEHFEDLVDAICVSLPGVKRHAVFDSVRHLAGSLLTEDLMNDTVWRLAGNLDLLKSGIAVPPWTVQTDLEWMPAHILDREFAQASTGAPGGMFRVRVLAGTACPAIIKTFWSNRVCALFARECGYTNRYRKRPYSHPKELCNLRTWILVDPEYCRQGKPGFRKIECTQTFKKWNHEIIDMRFRRGFLCPHDYKHHCYQCPIGYLDCPAGTHPFTIYAEDEDGEDDTESGSED